MKQEHEVAKNWDDLVFENKNKAYGAYLVRKSYSQNLTTGLGVSVCLACLLLIAPKIMSALFPGQQIIPDMETLKEDLATVFVQPPLVEPPPVQPPPAAATHSTFTPTVTTREVDTPPPTNAEIAASIDASNTGEGTVPGTEVYVAPVEIPVPVEPSIVTFAEVMPAYNGGLQGMYQFIARKLKYPRVAQRNGTEGTVFVSFVVSKEGKVTDVSVTKGISDECDKEAARVIAMLDQWTPGSQNHRAVNVRMTIPIKFQLEH